MYICLLEAENGGTIMVGSALVIVFLVLTECQRLLGRGQRLNLFSFAFLELLDFNVEYVLVFPKRQLLGVEPGRRGGLHIPVQAGQTRLRDAEELLLFGDVGVLDWT
ncbi:hypothetical protein E1178_13585 [Roseibium hamelinense]|nr:hypothetical protein [Roseibium hamelinense]